MLRLSTLLPHALTVLHRKPPVSEEVFAMQDIQEATLQQVTRTVSETPVDEPGSAEQRMALIKEFKEFYHARIPLLVPNHVGQIEIHTARSLIDSKDPSHSFALKERYLRMFFVPLEETDQLSFGTSHIQRWSTVLGIAKTSTTSEEEHAETLAYAHETQRIFFSTLTEQELLGLSYLQVKSEQEGKQGSFATMHAHIYGLHIPATHKRKTLDTVMQRLSQDIGFQELCWLFEQMNFSSETAFPRAIPQDTISTPKQPVLPPTPSIQSPKKSTLAATVRACKRSILAITTLTSLGLGMHTSSYTPQPAASLPNTDTRTESLHRPEVSPKEETVSTETTARLTTELRGLFVSTALQDWMQEEFISETSLLSVHSHVRETLQILQSHGGISKSRFEALAQQAYTQGNSFSEFLISLTTLPQISGNGVSQNYIAHLQYIYGYTEAEAYASPQWHTAYQKNFIKQRGGYNNPSMQDHITLTAQAFLATNGMVTLNQ